MAAAADALHPPRDVRARLHAGASLPGRDVLGNLLALAYKTSLRNIITNADAIHAIRRLGLEQLHVHSASGGRREVPPAGFAAARAALAASTAAGTSSSPWRGTTGRSRGTTSSSAASPCCSGGWAAARSSFWPTGAKKWSGAGPWCGELKLDDDVVWLPPLPKRRLAEYVNAADAVLDQFVLGCFGTTTPEAMACAKPVLLYYKPEDHDWCFPEHPPVLNAESPAEIAAAMERLLTRPQEAAEIGQRSREWFLRHHSLDLVVQRHLEIYRAIQGSPAVVRIPKEFAVRKESAKPAGPADVVAVVQSSGPLLIDGTADGPARDLRRAGDPHPGRPPPQGPADPTNRARARAPRSRGPWPPRRGWAGACWSKTNAAWGSPRRWSAWPGASGRPSSRSQSPFVDPETTASLLAERRRRFRAAAGRGTGIRPLAGGDAELRRAGRRCCGS